MKLNLIFILLLINFSFKPAFSSDKNSQKNIITKDNSGKMLDLRDFNERKFHTVQKGDSILSISRMYSLDKKFLIKINKIENENNIYIGQTLKLTDETSNKLNDQINSIPRYHKILEGENLTDISNRYSLKVSDLINLNNLENPDNIEVGGNLILNNTSKNIEQTVHSISKRSKKELVDSKQYGPLTIVSTKLEVSGRRKTLQVINKNKAKLILSLECNTKKIDVRKEGRKWKGWKPVKEKFEERLMNDFC